MWTRFKDKEKLDLEDEQNWNQWTGPASWPYNPVKWHRAPQPDPQTWLLSWMLCCHCFKILNNFWTKSPLFSFHFGPHMYPVLQAGVSYMQLISDPHGETFLFSHRVTELPFSKMFPFSTCINADAGQPHSRDVIGIIYSSSGRLDSAISPEPLTSFRVMITSQITANCLQWSIFYGHGFSTQNIESQSLRVWQGYGSLEMLSWWFLKAPWLRTTPKTEDISGSCPSRHNWKGTQHFVKCKQNTNIKTKL